MEAKLDALETRVVTALIVTHPWAARLAGAAYVGGSFGGGGGFPKGSASMRTHSGVIECVPGGWGWWWGVRVRLPDLHRLSLEAR